jgi:4,5-DOPA dioxygenase extradiol
VEASERMKKYLFDDDPAPLIGFAKQGKAFQLAIPTPEHYLPMLYALALRDTGEELSLFNDKHLGGSLTMTSFRIG